MYQLVEALVALAHKAGVEFRFNSTVEKVLIDTDDAHGIIVDGHRHEADAVLANADLTYACESLLPQNGHQEKAARRRHSCSVISFFWGVDRPYESLGPHTLFLADDYRENFDTIIRKLGIPSNPSLYVHAPARLDPSMAPEGEDTLIAIVPVGHISECGNQDWAKMRDQARQDVFRRLRTIGVDDLEAHIKFEINFTPLSWKKRYNLFMGSTHGLCHNLTQLGYLRPDYQHPRYRNLYFTGASTRPGTGLPSAMISGRQSAQRILDRY
jgi:phytoene desaturase